MNIVLSWDQSVTSSSNKANIEAAIQQAAAQLDSAITNNITVNIAVGWGEDAGTAVTGNTWGLGGPSSTQYLTYSSLTSALKTAATASGNASLTANLPATNPFYGSTWEIGSAEAQALGLGSLFPSASTPSSPDGSVGFNASVNWAYGTSNGIGTSQGDLVAVALHELAHALGRVDFSSSKVYDPLSLYTYTAPGTLASQWT
ncbi:MAG: NF038122 family metalloprotease, partial [Betaproteobacteria bacterium]|nr:NF038122 family metalloprotease [Betaproteobacteria bacterium]